MVESRTDVATDARPVRDLSRLEGPLAWRIRVRAALRARHKVANPRSALDAQARPGTRDGTTWRQVFAALRDGGVAPHAHGPDADEAVAGVLRAIARRTAARVTLSAAVQEVSTPEARVNPDAHLGIAEAEFTTAADETGNTKAYKYFGRYADTVADLAAMGAGNVRRGKKCDLYWASLFPQDATSVNSYQDGIEVPNPADLRAMMVADAFAVFGNATALLLACRAAGVKLTLTLFNSGGGAQLNGDVDSTESINGDTSLPRYDSLGKAAPAHLRAMLLVSSLGWSGWYWNWRGNGGTAKEQAFQKYVTSVWPSESTDAEDGYVSAYMRECARRKALGVAAFGDAVGEWLARLKLAIQPVFLGATDAIDVVEMGTELDHFYVLPPVETNAETSQLAAYSAADCGRYLALLAGPIRHRFKPARFRFELDSWGDRTHGLDPACGFLAATLRDGMTAELALWQLRLTSTSNDISAWQDACGGAGFAWPPDPASGTITFDATDLMHEVGFHHFHCFDQVPDAPGKTLLIYADEVRLLADVDTVETRVVGSLARHGFDLRVSVCASAFPGAEPVDPPQDRSYKGANELLQAGMLVRVLATLRAAGVERASWFTHMLTPLPVDAAGKVDGTSKFLAMGVHLDSYTTSKNKVDNARPKSAWYAYRRLVWLLATFPDGAEVLQAKQGFVVLRFTSRAGVSVGPDGTSLSATWTYAYLTWLDQYCHTKIDGRPESDIRSSTSAAFVLYAEGEEVSYETLSLSPRVRFTTGNDANGYPRASANWGWRGALAALTSTTQSELASRPPIWFRTFNIEAADPTDRPAPICILSNADALDVA